jgi:ribosomal protein S14
VNATEMAPTPVEPVIRCTRCGEDDGPFVDNGMCENCARAVSL